MGFDTPEETREMEDNLTWIIDRLKDQGQAIEGSVLHGVSKNLERLISATFQRGLQQQLLRSQEESCEDDAPSAHDPAAATAEAATAAAAAAAAAAATSNDAPHGSHGQGQPPGFDMLPPVSSSSSSAVAAGGDDLAQLMDIQLSRLAAMTPQTNMLNIGLAHPGGQQLYPAALGGLGGLGALAALGGLGGVQLGGLGLLSQLPNSLLSGLNTLHAHHGPAAAGAPTVATATATATATGGATPASTDDWPAAAAAHNSLPPNTAAGSQELMQYFLSAGQSGPGQSTSMNVNQGQGQSQGLTGATPEGSGLGVGAGHGPAPAPQSRHSGEHADPAPGAILPEPRGTGSSSGPSLLQPMFPPQVDWVSAWADLFDTLEERGDGHSTAAGSAPGY